MRTVLAVLGSALVLLAIAACGGSDQSAEMRGVVWRLSGLLEGETMTGLAAVPDPQNYLLALDEDGSFIARADCKSLGGTYSLSGDDLTLELGSTRKDACGKGSLSDRYIDLLGRVARYEIYEEGALALGLKDDLGYLYFYSAAD